MKHQFTRCASKNLIAQFCGRILVYNQAKSIFCLRNGYLYVVYKLLFCELSRSYFYRRSFCLRLVFFVKLWKEVYFLGLGQEHNTHHGNTFWTKTKSTLESLLSAEVCYESPLTVAIFQRNAGKRRYFSTTKHRLFRVILHRSAVIVDNFNQDFDPGWVSFLSKYCRDNKTWLTWESFYMQLEWGVEDTWTGTDTEVGEVTGHLVFKKKPKQKPIFEIETSPAGNTAAKSFWGSCGIIHDVLALKR